MPRRRYIPSYNAAKRARERRIAKLKRETTWPIDDDFDRYARLYPPDNPKFIYRGVERVRPKYSYFTHEFMWWSMRNNVNHHLVRTWFMDYRRFLKDRTHGGRNNWRFHETNKKIWSWLEKGESVVTEHNTQIEEGF